MASKRFIKKQLNGLIINIVDDCFSAELYKPALEEQTTKLIDEALDYRDEVLARIHQAKTKKDYPAIYDSIMEKGAYFEGKLTELQ